MAIFARTALLAQTNRAPYQFKKLYLPHGEHDITAQAMDNFGLRGTSAVARVAVHWPEELHRLRADLNTNGDCVVCMRALDGSNYVVETATHLDAPIPWEPGWTNGTIGSLLIFKNRPVEPQKYFRTRLWP